MALIQRHRLTLILLVLVAAGVGIALFLQQSDVAASFVSRTELERIARLTAERQESLADQTEQILRVLSKLPVVQSADAEECSAFLQTLLVNQERYVNFGVAKTDGTLFCSGVPFSAGQKVNDRAYFQRAMESGKFSVGDYQVGRVTGKPSINFGYPIQDAEGPITGVVFTAVDLSWLRDFSHVADLPPKTQLILADNKGVVLARHPEGPSGVVAPEINLSLVKIVDVQTGLGVLEMKDGADQSLYVVAMPVKLADQEGFVHVFVSIPKRYVGAASVSHVVIGWIDTIPFLQTIVAPFGV